MQGQAALRSGIRLVPHVMRRLGLDDPAARAAMGQAARAALDRAGMQPDEIDAIVVGSVFGPPGVATRIQRGLGIGGVPMWTIENACASGTSARPYSRRRARSSAGQANGPCSSGGPRWLACLPSSAPGARSALVFGRSILPLTNQPVCGRPSYAIVLEWRGSGARPACDATRITLTSYTVCSSRCSDSRCPCAIYACTARSRQSLATVPCPV